jgi:hypothetical protein
MSQKTRILQHLQEGRSLNRLDSWQELGVLAIATARKCG